MEKIRNINMVIIGIIRYNMEILVLHIDAKA